MAGLGGTNRNDEMDEARALLAALGVPLPDEALPSLDANRRLLAEHWARLRPAGHPPR